MATLTLESVDLEAERLLAVAETARRHFAELAKLLEASGPAFAPSHRLAMAVERAGDPRLHGVDQRRGTRQPVQDERLAVE